MDYNTKCGPNTIDNYDDYDRWRDGTYFRLHYIEGTGYQLRSKA